MAAPASKVDDDDSSTDGVVAADVPSVTSTLAAISSVTSERFSGDVATQFLHHVLDDLCGRSVDFFHLYSCETADLTTVVSGFQGLFVTALNSKLSKDQVAAAAAEQAVPEAHCGAVAEVFVARQDGLREAMTEKLATISDANLADFDWSLRMTFASDSASGMRRPILVVNLTIADASGAKRDVMLELTESDLDSVLSSLSEVNEVTRKLVV